MWRSATISRPRHWASFWIPACLILGCGRQPPIPKADSLVDPYQQGILSLNAQRYDEAIAQFTQAIGPSSQSGELYVQRGRAYVAKGFPDTAIEDFNQAVRLGPLGAEARLERGRAHLLLGSPLRAVSDFTHVIRLQPESAMAYEQRGLAYLQLRNSDRAIADLQEALRLDKQLAAAVNPRIDEAKRRLAEARNSADKPQVATTGPPPIAQQPSSEIANRAPRLDDPSQVARRVTRKPTGPPDPADADEHYLRGTDLLTEARYEDAIREFSEALVADPRFGAAYVGRGTAHLARGSADTAARDFSDALIRDPSDVEAFCLRARARLLVGDYSSAAHDATEALRRRVDSPQAYELRLEAYLGQQDCQRARGDYDELVRQAPQRAAEYRTRLAEAYYRQLQLQITSLPSDQAIDNWCTLRTLKPRLAGDIQEELAEAILARGRKHSDRGYFAEAEADLAALRRMEVRQAAELESHIRDGMADTPRRQAAMPGGAGSRIARTR